MRFDVCIMESSHSFSYVGMHQSAMLMGAVLLLNTRFPVALLIDKCSLSSRDTWSMLGEWNKRGFTAAISIQTSQSKSRDLYKRLRIKGWLSRWHNLHAMSTASHRYPGFFFDCGLLHGIWCQSETNDWPIGSKQLLWHLFCPVSLLLRFCCVAVTIFSLIPNFLRPLLANHGL